MTVDIPTPKRVPWSALLICLFWILSTVIAIIVFISGNPAAPGLKHLYLLKIESQDNVLSADQYRIGVYGFCAFTRVGDSYKLRNCTTMNRVPFFWTIVDLLSSNQWSNTAWDHISSNKGYRQCIKAVWVLLVIYIAINCIGLVFAVIGLRWSSICREIAVNLGILNLIIVLVYSAIATAVYSKIKSDLTGVVNSGITASIGHSEIALMWCLLAFCYVCYGIITIRLKKRNREIEEAALSKIRYDAEHDASTLRNDTSFNSEIKNMPSEDSFNSLHSTLKSKGDTPENSPRAKRSVSEGSAYGAGAHIQSSIFHQPIKTRTPPQSKTLHSHSMANASLHSPVLQNSLWAPSPLRSGSSTPSAPSTSSRVGSPVHTPVRGSNAHKYGTRSYSDGYKTGASPRSHIPRQQSPLVAPPKSALRYSRPALNTVNNTAQQSQSHQ